MFKLPHACPALAGWLRVVVEWRQQSIESTKENSIKHKKKKQKKDPLFFIIIQRHFVFLSLDRWFDFRQTFLNTYVHNSIYIPANIWYCIRIRYDANNQSADF